MYDQIYQKITKHSYPPEAAFVSEQRFNNVHFAN